ncbi:MAG: DUF1707 domain-containing protein [Propionibacteriaceae bacterium]|nr:DUF1707 domain-containing protein [Propionibacteriaceae bacterium]
MSGQPVEQRYANNPAAAVDDADRTLVEERLKQAYVEGDIDIDEFFMLLERLWAARVGGELVPVLRALPASLRHTGPALGSDPVGGPPGVAPRGPSIFQRRR